ncbi:MAG TPA: MFS transporter [Actinomycetota bacterium]|nr:MFS transporter [Actinomycetota bacterium]
MSAPSEHRPGKASRLRRLAIDLAPLRVSRQFRLVWVGLLVSSSGSQFTVVAVFVQVTRLTGSEAAVGLTGLVWLAGLVVGSIAGGTVLDSWDRRRLLIVAQLVIAVGVATLLAGSIAGDPPIGVIYAGLAVMAAASAIDGPTRSAMTPRLVGPELIPSAQALNQVIWNGAGIFGPALAGITIQRFGVTLAYAIDLVSVGMMLLAALALHPMPPEERERNQTGLRAVREGFAYVRASRLLQSTFAIDLVAMVFGMPRALFTFLAVEQFGRGVEIIGLLFSAPAVGALLGALTSGWTRSVRRQGQAVAVAVAAWGAAIAGFGLVGDRLWLALVMLALAGWADVISAIFRSTILQLSVPDRLRGRLSGIHSLVVTGGPRLGDFEAGLVARLVSPGFSVVSGGIACILGAGVVALAYPELRRHRAEQRV